jgi:hypothetical protein
MASFKIREGNASIRIKIIAVMEFIKACGFRGLCIFLVQLLESEDPEVKLQVGRLLPERGL